jgi:hypothetical protein
MMKENTSSWFEEEVETPIQGNTFISNFLIGSNIQGILNSLEIRAGQSDVVSSLINSNLLNIFIF